MIGILYNGTFCVWLFLSLMFLRVIHIAASIGGPLLFYGWIILHHGSTALHCAYTSPVKACPHTCTCGMAGSYDNSVLHYLSNCPAVFHGACTLHIPASGAGGHGLCYLTAHRMLLLGIRECLGGSGCIAQASRSAQLQLVPAKGAWVSGPQERFPIRH